MRHKLKSNRAETLVETLVSVLIISISSVALAAMLKGASNVNKSAKEYDEKVTSAVQSMISGTASTGKASVNGKEMYYIKIRTSDDELKIYSYAVDEINPVVKK